MGALQYVAKSNKQLNQRLAMDSGKLGGVAMAGLAMMKPSSLRWRSGFFREMVRHQSKFLNSIQETAPIALSLAADAVEEPSAAS